MADLSKMMYNSIHDMPIFNWYMLSNNNDFNFLLKEYAEICNENNIAEFEKRSNELTQEYLDMFGADGDSEMMMTYLKTEIRLTADLLLTGNQFLKNQIALVQQQIKALIPTETKNSLEANLVRVSKYVGYGVESKKTSVVRYRETMNMIEEDTKNAKKWQNNQ